MTESPSIETTPLLGRPSEALVFRLRNTAREGQLIRLAAAKCTVGSAAHCTLRLQAAGIQPVHCLILRGPHQTIVRRWSKHTRLNEQPFADARLNVGDRLAIGPLDLEVLDGTGEQGPVVRGQPSTLRLGPEGGPAARGPLSEDEESRAGDVASGFGQATSHAALADSRLEPLERQMEALAAQLRQASLPYRKRIRRLRRQLERSRQQIVALESQSTEQSRRFSVAEAERAGMEAELGRLTAELAKAAARFEAIEADRVCRLAETAAAAETAAKMWRQFKSRAKQLQQFKHELSEARDRWQTELASREAGLREQIDEHRRQVESLRQQAESAAEQAVLLESRKLEIDAIGVANQETKTRIEAELADVLARKQQFDAGYDAWLGERQRHQQKLTDRAKELDAQRQDLAESRDQWQLVQQREAKKLAAREESVEQTMAEIESREASLQAKRQELATGEESLESRVKSLSADQESLRAERNSIEAQLQALATERTALQAEIQELHFNREKFSAQISSQFAALDAEREVFETNRTTVERRQSDLETEWQAVEALRQALATRDEECAAQRGALESDRAALGMQVAEFEAERVEFANRKTTLENERQSLETQQGAFESARAAIAADRAESESQFGRLETERRSIESQRTILTTERNEFEAQRQSHAADHRSLEEIRELVEAGRREVDAERQVVEADRQRVDADRKAIETDRQSLTSDRQSLDEFQQGLDAARQEIDTERQSLLVVDRQLATRQEEIVAQQQELVAQRQNATANEQTARIEEPQSLLPAREQLAAEEHRLAEQQKALTSMHESLASERMLLEVERRSFELDRQSQVADLDSRMTQVHDAAERASREAASLAAARDGFLNEQHDWSSARDQLQTRLAEGLEKCQQQSAYLDNLRTKFEQQQSIRQQQQLDAQRQFDARQALLDRRAEELEETRRELDCRREPIEAAALAAVPPAIPARERPANDVGSPATTEVSAEPESPSATDDCRNADCSTDDIFARLRTLSILKPEACEPPSDESLEIGQPPVAEPTIEPRGSAAEHGSAAAANPPSISESEESIDDYMARLLNRVRGISGEPATGTKQGAKPGATKPATVKPAVAPLPVADMHSAEAVTVVEQAIEKPADQEVQVIQGPLVARSAPPEMAANIAAMRELANTAARRAISHHAKGRWGKLAMGKTVSAIVVLGFGLWLVWQSLAGNLALRYCGLAAVIVAGYWLAQAAVLTRNVRQMNHRGKKAVATDPSADSQSAATDGHAKP